MKLLCILYLSTLPLYSTGFRIKKYLIFFLLEHSSKIEELFRKYLDNQCSPEELQSLMGYFRVDDLKDVLTGIIARLLEESAGADQAAADTKLEEILLKINKKKNPGKL